MTKLIKFSQNIGFSKEKQVFVFQLDFGSTIFGQQDFIADTQRCGVQVTRHITFSGSGSDHGTLVGVFRGIRGQVNATGRLDFFGCPSDQNAVTEGFQVASKEGLYNN